MIIEYIVLIGLVLVACVLPFFYKAPPSPLSNEAVARMKTESPIERRLFDALVFRGYSPQTQVRCGKYRIDLALPSYNLALECDGKAYHSAPSQKARDRRRDAYLTEHGWKVLRFSGSQINGNLKGVLKRIENEIDKSINVEPVGNE